MTGRCVRSAVLTATLLIPTTTAALERGPLQAFEVVFLLERGVSPARVRHLVGRIGIAFQPSPEVLEVVWRAGADPPLLDALRAAAPPSTTLASPSPVPARSSAPRPAPALPFEPQMVLVRGGPRGDFFIGKHEITNRQFAAYCERMSQPRPPAPFWPAAAGLPVVNVTWHDANSYCRWLSLVTGRRYRLPTETEWEFAARAGRLGRTYPWGEDPPEGRACFGKGAPCPVGSFRANAFGIHDLVGGVAEWCADDSTRPEKAKAVRGGDWTVAARDTASVSIARRERLDPDKRRNSVGFRVARDP
jgi:formylglycine-generating enzyme required for sulfatase activity